MNNRDLFLIILEAGSLRSGLAAWLGKAYFWVADLSLYPYLVERQGSYLRPLYEGISLIH